MPTRQAIVLDKPSSIEHKPLRLADLPTPVPHDNQILVKVSHCGLCHTDLDEIEGRLPPTKSPIVLGHQIVGTVADKGKAAAKLANLPQMLDYSILCDSTGFHIKCNVCPAFA